MREGDGGKQNTEDHSSGKFEVCAFLDCGLQFLVAGFCEGGGEFAGGFGDGRVQVKADELQWLFEIFNGQGLLLYVQVRSRPFH